MVQGAGTGVTLDQGAVTNSGTWQLNWHGGIQGGGTFTNTASGTVHKTGPNQADINVPFTNNGAIDVDGGALGLQTPVSLAPTTYQVAEGAQLNIGSVNGVAVARGPGRHRRWRRGGEWRVGQLWGAVGVRPR